MRVAWLRYVTWIGHGKKTCPCISKFGQDNPWRKTICTKLPRSQHHQLRHGCAIPTVKSPQVQDAYREMVHEDSSEAQGTGDQFPTQVLGMFELIHWSWQMLATVSGSAALSWNVAREHRTRLARGQRILRISCSLLSHSNWRSSLSWWICHIDFFDQVLFLVPRQRPWPKWCRGSKKPKPVAAVGH